MNESLFNFLVYVYSFIEIFVVVWFTCELSNIRIKLSSLMAITILRMAVIMGVRETIEINLLIISSVSVFSNILFIWIFSKTNRISVVIYSFISLIILNIVGSISFTLGQKYLSNINEDYLWFITGLPLIITISGITALYKLYKNIESKKDFTNI